MRVLRRTAVLVVALLGAVVAYVQPASAATTIHGTVQCVTGARMVGVWVSANSGGSGWASWTPRSTSVANYSYTLPYGGTYHLNVGCGGSSGAWASSNSTPNVGGNAYWFTCYDLINIGQGGYYGTCQIT